jgi:hypothetical protein
MLAARARSELIWPARKPPGTRRNPAPGQAVRSPQSASAAAALIDRHDAGADGLGQLHGGSPTANDSIAAPPQEPVQNRWSESPGLGGYRSSAGR